MFKFHLYNIIFKSFPVPVEPVLLSYGDIRDFETYTGEYTEN